MSLSDQLQQGIAAAQAGDRQRARALLTAVVEADENQPDAWWYLSEIVDSPEEREICLSNLLALEPDNSQAKAELAEVQAQRAQFLAQDQISTPPPQVVPEPDKTPITSEYLHQDEFANEWLCPFCTAPTNQDDKSCPKCQQKLIIFTKSKRKRSVWLWRGIFFQYIVGVYLIFFGVGALVLMGRSVGIRNPIPFLPIYFGLPISASPRQSEALLGVFPPWVFWSIIILAIYTGILMLILYTQIRNGHLFYLINAGFTIALGGVGLYLFRANLIAFIISAVGATIGIAQLFISAKLWRDFDHRMIRLKLVADPDVRDHISFYDSAKKYASQNMWGLAVIHLRRAVAEKPNVLAYQMALTTAYANIKRFDLAKESYLAAKQIAPNEPQVKQLGQKVGAMNRAYRDKQKS